MGRWIVLKKRLLVVGLVSLFCALWFFIKLQFTGVGTPWGELYLGWLIVPFFICLSMFLYSGGIIDGIDGLAGGVFFDNFFGLWFDRFSSTTNKSGHILFCFSWRYSGIFVVQYTAGAVLHVRTGSMALTITLSVVVFMTGTHGNGYGILVLPIVAAPLVVTTFSVIIQTFQRIAGGKKVFLWHHFIITTKQKVGHHTKVTMRYWILSIIFAIIGVIVAFLGKPI